MATLKCTTLQHSSGTGGVDIQGTNTNDAAATGDIGEVYSVTGSQTTLSATAATYTAITGASQVFQPGDYLVRYDIVIDTNTNDGTGANFRYHYCQLYNSSDSTILDTLLVGYSNATLPGANRHRIYAVGIARVSLSAAKTIILRAGTEEAGS